MSPNLFWIPGPWRGRLAVLLRPRGEDWLEDEAEGWKRAGLDIVVSLLERDEAAQLGLAREAEVAHSKGMRFLSFPIPDRGVPGSTKEAISLLGNLAAALEEGATVAIHCRQSVGRSGLVTAGLLVTSGMSADRAIAVVSTARGQTVPETHAQLQWITGLSSEQLTLAS